MVHNNGISIAKNSSKGTKKSKSVPKARRIKVVVNAKPKKSSKSKSKKVSLPRASRVAVTECTKHLAIAVGNPFSPLARGACVPTFPARMSRKTSAFVRGQCFIGTGNIGFVSVQPCVANDMRTISSTTGAFTLSTMAANDVNVNVYTTPTNPYPKSSYMDGTLAISPSYQSRIVACALRIRYTGTELNKSGVIYGLTHPDHSNMYNYTLADMTSFPECVRVPVSRQWTTICTTAVDPTETAYPESSTAIALAGNDGTAEHITMLYPYSQKTELTSGASSYEGGIVMGFMISSTPGNSFEWEYVIHMETIGKGVGSSATRSHSDQDGLSKVTEAAGRAQGLRGNTGAPWDLSFAQSFGETIRESAQAIYNVASVANDILGPGPFRPGFYIEN